MKESFEATSHGSANERSISQIVHVSILLGGLLTAFAGPAWSTIVYNYSHDWMYDSTSGLYWQAQEIPTTTFL